MIQHNERTVTLQISKCHELLLIKASETFEIQIYFLLEEKPDTRSRLYSEMFDHRFHHVALSEVSLPRNQQQPLAMIVGLAKALDNIIHSAFVLNMSVRDWH